MTSEVGSFARMATLVQAWRDFARRLLPYSPAAAEAFQEAATQLEREVQATTSTLLTLAEAAGLSGYSQDRLRRLASEGKLVFQRNGRRLLFRTVDLPQKPGKVASRPVDQYDPIADARQVAAVRSRGGQR